MSEVRELGTGFACAVGKNSAGAYVRVTDSACVTGLTFYGRCDASGHVTPFPLRIPYVAPFYDVRDFGAVADWNGSATGVGCTDNLAAFNACLARYETDGGVARGQRVYLPGNYWLSGTLHIRQNKTFDGVGASDENKGPGTMLVFPKNCDGIRVHSTGSADDPTSNAAYSVFRNMTLYCGDATSTSGHGFWTAVPVECVGVHVLGFAYNGLELSADSGYHTGNASTSRFISCRFGASGRHGIHVFGGDASACVFVGCSTQNNNGWNVCDESGLGNQYIGHHAEGCLGNIANLTASVDSGSSTIYVIDQTPGCSDGTNNDNNAIPFYCSGFAFQLSAGQQITIAGVSGTKTVSAIAGTSKAVLAVVTVVADSAGRTFTRTGASPGSWIADGFAVGDYVRSAGFPTATNNFIARKVTGLTATVMTFSAGTFASETAAAGSVAVYCTRATINSAASATVVSASVAGGYSVDAANHDYRIKGPIGGDGNPTSENYSSVFGCYSEASINDFATTVQVEGGIAPTFPTFNKSAFRMSGGTSVGKQMSHYDASGTPTIITELGTSDGSLAALTFSRADTSDYCRLRLNASTDNWEFQNDATTTAVPLAWPSTGSGAARGGTLFGPYVPCILYGEKSVEIVHKYGTAAPGSGTWRRGDIVWNSTPSEAGSAGNKYVIVGWSCVDAAGSGTWKEMRTLTGA